MWVWLSQKGGAAANLRGVEVERERLARGDCAPRSGGSRVPPGAPVKCPGCAERARSAPLAARECARSPLLLEVDSPGAASVTDPARPRLRPGTSPVRQEVAMSRPSHARNTQLEVRAREMRLCPTLSEARLWQALRGNQLGVAVSPAGGHRGLHRRFLGARCLIGRRSRWGLSLAALRRRWAARSVSRARWISGASLRSPAGHGGFAGRPRSHRRAAGLSAVAREARAARRSPERCRRPRSPGRPARP
jgi:hypothetical protein